MYVHVWIIHKSQPIGSNAPAWIKFDSRINKILRANFGQMTWKFENIVINMLFRKKCFELTNSVQFDPISLTV